MRIESIFSAGLTNVGGEGQLVLGGVAAAGVVRWLGEGAPSAVTLTVMLAQANVEPVPATMIIWAGARTRAEPTCCW